MPRTGYRDENRLPAIIKAAIPVEPPGSTWSTIWSQVKGRIKSKETVANHLRKLEDTGQVLKDGKYYRLNPALHYDYPEGIRIWLRSDDAKKRPTEFSDKTFVDPDNFRIYTGLLFNNIYRLYITMLNELVKIPAGAAATELTDLFMRAEVTPVLSDYALDVWRNRGTVKIVDALGGTTLEQLDSPVKWISRRPVDVYTRLVKKN